MTCLSWEGPLKDALPTELHAAGLISNRNTRLSLRLEIIFRSCKKFQEFDKVKKESRDIFKKCGWRTFIVAILQKFFKRSGPNFLGLFFSRTFFLAPPIIRK